MTILPLNLLKSSDVSLIEKSAWKGAICSRRINRCLIINNCPSRALYNGINKATLKHII